MAGALVRASSQYLSLSSAPVTAAPLTMACWFQADQANFQILMSICRSSISGDFWRLGARGDTAGDPVEFIVGSQTNGQGDTAANTTSGFTSGTWYHACGVENSSSSRSVFLNGGSKGTGSTNVTPASVNAAYIGAYKYGDFAVEAFLNGAIGEAVIYNAALTDAEVASLAKGYSPLLIRPQSIVAYVPWVREITDHKSNVWTNNNGAGVQAHPGVIMPRRRAIGFAGTSPPPPPPPSSTYPQLERFRPRGLTRGLAA